MLARPVAGVRVDEKGAEGIAAVGACLSILGDAVATATPRLYRREKGKKVELDLSPLLQQPWSEINQIDFFGQVARAMAARGNAWGQIVQRDRLGYPMQIVLVHNDAVHVRRDTNGTPQSNPNYGQPIYRFGDQIIPRDDVFHVPYIMSAGSLHGINPIEQYRNEFGLAMAADLYAGGFFSNSARPDGILKAKGDLTPSQAREIAQTWMENHQGIANSSLPGILSGDIDYQQISISPKDAQFIEARGLSKADIGMIFRVPAHKLNIPDRSPVATDVESTEIEFVRDPLLGYVKRIEAAMTACHPRGQWVELDLSDRLRGATLTRYQGYAVARTIGVLTPNEIRAEENRDPLPDTWANDAMAPLNSAQNGSLANPAEANPNDPTKIDKPSN